MAKRDSEKTTKEAVEEKKTEKAVSKKTTPKKETKKPAPEEKKASSKANSKKTEKKEIVSEKVKEEPKLETKEIKENKEIKETKVEKIDTTKRHKTELDTEEELGKTTLFVTDEFKGEQEKLEKEKRKKEQEKKAKKERRRERRKEIWKEVKAFLILFGSIGLICFGVWYWYTYCYDKDKNKMTYEKVEKQIAEYKTIRYSLTNEEDYLTVINDKYLIEKDDDTIYKIMDLKSTILFDGEEKFQNVYEGTNNKIYAYKESGLSFENIIELYVLKDGEFERIKVLSDTGVVFNPIIYRDDDNSEKLVGFAGLYTGLNENLETVSETKIYTVDEKEYDVENYYFVGDNEPKIEKEAIITYDPKYVIFYEIINNKKKYGLYDIEEAKVIIEPQYEGLHTNQLNYIAVRNGKTGIISSKLKKIVDFQYDFIDRHNDYYVVCKNNKLAIMNDDYKIITDFVYDYQASDENLNYSYYLSDTEINTFTSSKINNKYILSINNGEEKGYTYAKHNTYFIEADGVYETITANKFFISPNSSLIYSYQEEDKKYIMYDQDLNELYAIDLSEYDYTGYPNIELVNENTIIVHINSNIYFNYETGEEIDKPSDYQTLINGVTISYSNKTGKVEYRVNDNTVATIPVNISEDNVYFKKVNDNILYYNTAKDYVYIEKGE